jgi:hydroxypyruvate reductase
MREGEPQAWCLLSAGTDGLDGPTDAAGAIVDAVTLRRAAATGLDPAGELERNNSYDVLDAAGDLLRTGPTGTNVGDVQVLLVVAGTDRA